MHVSAVKITEKRIAVAIRMNANALSYVIAVIAVKILIAVNVK